MASNFFAALSRMKYIERWALMRSSRPENLSEHSLETAVIAHALATIGNVRLGKALDADRAANYHADGKGTQAAYEAVSCAVSARRNCAAPLSADWSAGVNRDYESRKRKK